MLNKDLRLFVNDTKESCEVIFECVVWSIDKNDLSHSYRVVLEASKKE